MKAKVQHANTFCSIQVFWSDAGDLVAIVCEESFYILRYNAQAYERFIESGGDPGLEGVEEAFEFVNDITET